MAAAICKHAGAKTVIITDINDYRLGEKPRQIFSLTQQLKASPLFSKT